MRGEFRRPKRRAMILVLAWFLLFSSAGISIALPLFGRTVGDEYLALLLLALGLGLALTLPLMMADEWGFPLASLTVDDNRICAAYGIRQRLDLPLNAIEDVTAVIGTLRLHTHKESYCIRGLYNEDALAAYIRKRISARPRWTMSDAHRARLRRAEWVQRFWLLAILLSVAMMLFYGAYCMNLAEECKISEMSIQALVLCRTLIGRVLLAELLTCFCVCAFCRGRPEVQYLREVKRSAQAYTARYHRLIDGTVMVRFFDDALYRVSAVVWKSGEETEMYIILEQFSLRDGWMPTGGARCDCTVDADNPDFAAIRAEMAHIYPDVTLEILP